MAPGVHGVAAAGEEVGAGVGGFGGVCDGVGEAGFGCDVMAGSSGRVWARMQVELLNRRRWRTRLELSNAIFEYCEIFHNRQRWHSSLGMLTAVEYEIRHAATTVRDQPR